MIEHGRIPFSAGHLTGHKALVLAPHADDEVLGPGGALLQHKMHGDLVKLIVVTEDPAAPAVRLGEMRRAASLLGVSAVETWNLAERALDPALLREKISGALKMFVPELLYLPHPVEIHPDHEAVSEAGWAAVTACGAGARPKVAFYEVSAPLPSVNLLVDITGEMPAKQDAMRCYSSQIAQSDYIQKISGLNAFRTYTLPPRVRYAEAYYLTDKGQKELPFALRAWKKAQQASPRH